MYSRLGVMRRRAEISTIIGRDLECFRGKRNLQLQGVNPAWWALKKSTLKRQHSGGENMEIDSVAGKQLVGGLSPPPGILRNLQDQEAKLSSGTPRSLETTRNSEMSSRHVLEGSPIAPAEDVNTTLREFSMIVRLRPVFLTRDLT